MDAPLCDPEDITEKVHNFLMKAMPKTDGFKVISQYIDSDKNFKRLEANANNQIHFWNAAKMYYSEEVCDFILQLLMLPAQIRRIEKIDHIVDICEKIKDLKEDTHLIKMQMILDNNIK